MTEIRCTNCHRPYPEQGATSQVAPYRCPTCTGLFDYAGPFDFDPAQVARSQPGLWRYRHSLGLPQEAPVVSLGEGNTPLIWREVLGRRLGFKLEFLNPSGAYKDRGSAVLTSFLRSRGVEAAVEDSSGNAGASFAAYAAAAGIQARIFVPDATSGPKLDQIKAYGAEVIRVMGPRSNAAEAVLKAVDQGAVYASHAYLPHVLAGYATIAYELYEQVGGVPGAVVAPAGAGNLLLAMARGFLALQQAGLIERIPVMVGVQALACAPLWALFQYGGAGLSMVAEAPTLAEGVRVRHPVRGDAVMEMLAQQQGLLAAVDEPDILPGRDALAHLGFYVEPTSAIVWNGLQQVSEALPDPVVLVLTGSGLKYHPA
jgi:threonine synthase